MQALRQSALRWLASSEVADKVSGVTLLNQAWLTGNIVLDAETHLSSAYNIPGRPAKPALVSPRAVEKRSMRTIEGRAALVHAIAHIEFNAINLALDAIWRFANMPPQYYADWLNVAAEEAYHFTLLNNYLQSLGFQYGDFTGHNSLWEMVERTSDDVLSRMALVPRTMEARGLDASPPLRQKFAQIGESKVAEILDIILHDEIGHVAVGNHWFNWLCAQRALEPIATFAQLCSQYNAPKLRPPFNIQARKLAGFTEAELALLA
ncbi:MAG: ferritin-like domain-containing protein [Methylophilaceae bacterium]